VNFDEYARTAVDLVNAQVDTLEQVRAFYGPESWQAAEVTDRDLATLRKGARRLREVLMRGRLGDLTPRSSQCPAKASGSAAHLGVRDQRLACT
jgi:hypothetical protein